MTSASDLRRDTSKSGLESAVRCDRHRKSHANMKETPVISACFQFLKVRSAFCGRISFSVAAALVDIHSLLLWHQNEMKATMFLPGVQDSG